MTRFVFSLLALFAIATPVTTFAVSDAELEGRSDSTSSSGSSGSASECVGTSFCGCYPESNFGGTPDLPKDAEGDPLATSAACSAACTTGSWILACFNRNDQTVVLDSSNSSSTRPEITIEVTKANEVTTPNLIVDIPGVDFSNGVGYDAEGNLRTNFLATYIDGVYRFLIPAMTIVAVVMLMISGMQYILARGNADQIKKSKHRMSNAVVGLVLLLAAYNIAYVVNPDFLTFQPLSIQTVPLDTLATTEENPDEQDPGAINTAEVREGVIAASSGDYLIVKGSETQIHEDVYAHLLEAAADYYTLTDGLNIVLKSASRTLESQATLFYNRCLKSGRCTSSAACDPTGYTYGVSNVVTKNDSGTYQLTGDLAGVDITNSTAVIAGLVADGKTNVCPHTSNVAVDVWPESSPGNFQANVDDMNDLVATMTDPANGFCRLKSEPWHFELEDMKTSTTKCLDTYSDSSYGNNYPQAGCLVWDYGTSNINVDPKDCCVQPRDPEKTDGLTMCKK